MAHDKGRSVLVVLATFLRLLPMDNRFAQSICPGCRVMLPETSGPTHRYMTSTPACYDLFKKVLACEYSDPELLSTHRLTVDTYAVQHPGNDGSRQQIQSVGLHLARLGRQLANPMPPSETNDVMLGLGPHKHTLVQLTPPERFRMTVDRVARVAGASDHTTQVRKWAIATWEDWSDHHGYIQDWTQKYLAP